MSLPAVRQAQAMLAQAAAKAVNVRATLRQAAAVPHAPAQNMCARKAHLLHAPLHQASTAVAEAIAQAVPTTGATHRAAAITEAARLRGVPLQVRDVVQVAATVAEAAVQAPQAIAQVRAAIAQAAEAVAVAVVAEEDNYRSDNGL